MKQNDQHEIDNEDPDENDGSLRVNGPFGTGMRLPPRLVEGIIPAFARWIVPTLAIAIGVCAICWGDAQVLVAMRSAAP